MTTIADAAQRILDAVSTVDGVRGYLDADAVTKPPAVVVGAPRIYWDELTPDASRAVFTVAVVVAANDRKLDRLWRLVPAVASAISDADAGEVDEGGATPVTFQAGGASLPAYSLSVTTTLGE